MLPSGRYSTVGGIDLTLAHRPRFLLFKLYSNSAFKLIRLNIGNNVVKDVFKKHKNGF